MTKEFKVGDRVYHKNNPDHEEPQYYCKNGDLIEVGKEYLDVAGDKLYCVRITHDGLYPILWLYDNNKTVMSFAPSMIESLWENRTHKVLVNGKGRIITKEQYTKIMEIIIGHD